MSSEAKQILVVGFGAVGIIYSLILKAGGKTRITAVARGNYEIVTEMGVHIKSSKFGNIEGWKPDRVCRSVAEAADQPYSYVLVSTKAIPEVMKTSLLLAPLLAKEYIGRFAQPTYVLAQNGLNVETELYNSLKALGKEDPRIISCGLWINTNFVLPNIVEHGNSFNRLAIGVYRPNNNVASSNTPIESSLLSEFAKLINDGGGTATIHPEIQRVKFTKNFWNIAFSSLTTLTRYTLPAIFRPPPSNPSVSYEPFVHPATADLISKYTLPSIEATLDELVAVGRALGYPDSDDGVPSSLPKHVLEVTAPGYTTPNNTQAPSMLLDAEKGNPMEVEVIFGEVVRMAKVHGVEVPRLETLYALLLVIQNQILRKIEGGRKNL